MRPCYPLNYTAMRHCEGIFDARCGHIWSSRSTAVQSQSAQQSSECPRQASIEMETIRKLAILADAAKYDASCASSGTIKRDSRASGGIGSTEGMGICHSYTPDGRCVSLLKILLTNFCIYDC